MPETVPDFSQETTCASTYTTRPISIEAIRYDGTNLAAIKEWVGPRYEGDPFQRDGFIEVSEQWVVDPSDDVTALIWDKLHDTWVGVKDGQWIIRGTEGEFYPCADSVFQRKYQRLAEHK